MKMFLAVQIHVTIQWEWKRGSKPSHSLKNSNPTDTVKVATFLRNKQYKPNEIIKKDHYYVCQFTWQPYRKIKEYKNSEDITYEGSETT